MQTDLSLIHISRTGEDQPLAVRAPEGRGLDVVRVVCAGQRLKLASVFAVPGEHTACGIEDLAETVAVIETVVEAIEDARTVGCLLYTSRCV